MGVLSREESGGEAREPRGPAGAAALRFDEAVHAGLREGYVSLTWGPDEAAIGDDEAARGNDEAARGNDEAARGNDEGSEDASEWAKEAGIREYRVTDETGSVYYRGEFTRAFISGLPDGVHTFTVDGIDADGGVITSSVEPAVITVNHWPLSYAWVSFFVGLVVVASLLSVIVAGAVSSRDVNASGPGSPASDGVSRSDGGVGDTRLNPREND